MILASTFWQIDAHVGGVNDLAFSYPNKQLCIVTCGDDKLIKVGSNKTLCAYQKKKKKHFVNSFFIYTCISFSFSAELLNNYYRFGICLEENSFSSKATRHLFILFVPTRRKIFM